MILRFWNTLTYPFRKIRQSIWSARYNNPLKQAQRETQSLKGQGNVIKRQLRIPGVSNNPVWEDIKDTFQDLRPEKKRKKREIEVESKAEYSQIHIRRLDRNERIVLHIGVMVGSQSSDVQIKGVGHHPLTLRFTQNLNTEDKHFQIEVQKLTGTDTVYIDDELLQKKTVLSDHSVWTINNIAYECELFAWSSIPQHLYSKAGWFTSSGAKRNENQDTIGIYPAQDTYFFAIADGVGKGYQGGEVSRYTIQYLLTAFGLNLSRKIDWQEMLKQALQIINTEVRRSSYELAELMGSTVSVIIIHNWVATIAQLGDSRIYRFRNNRLEQLTEDFVEHKMIDGVKQSILTTAIGKKDSLDLNISKYPVLPGDQFVLCTDGIHDNINDQEIQNILSTQDISFVAEKLVALANERKSTDNCSAIAFAITSQEIEKKIWNSDDPRVFIGVEDWSLKVSGKNPYLTHYEEGEGTKIPGCFIVSLIIVMILSVAFGFMIILLGN